MNKQQKHHLRTNKSFQVFLINKVALLKFHQSKEEGKYQELIQSNTTPDPVFLINKVAFLKFHQSKEEGKYQELIQSNTTPDPGHHAGKVTKTQENITYKRAKRSALSSMWPQGYKKRADKHKIQMEKGIHNWSTVLEWSVRKVIEFILVKSL